MKQTLLFFYAALLTATAFAQPVIKTQKVFGGSSGDGFSRMCLTKDGGLLLGGSSSSDRSGNKSVNSKGDADMWIVKTTGSGNKQWDRTIGGNLSDYLSDVKATNDGGYIMISQSRSDISGDKTEARRSADTYLDYWVVKVDSAGTVQWDKTLGGSVNDVPCTIEQTKDSGYIIAGWSLSSISGEKTENNKGGTDIWLVKLNAAGSKQWDKTIGGSADDGATSGTTYSGDDAYPVLCRQMSDGGYLIGATSLSNISGDKTANSRGGADYWLVKTDNAGNVVWDKTIGGSSSDYLNALELTADGGYITGGFSSSGISGEKTENRKGGFDYWIVKLNSAGAIQWDKTIGGGGYDVLTIIRQTSEGGYIAGGYSSSGKSGDKSAGSKGGQDFWIVKTNSTGDIEWNKTIGGNSTDQCYDIKEVAPNNYWIGGSSSSDISGDKKLALVGGSDYWLVKLVYTAPAATAALITSTNLNSNKDIAPAKAFLVYPNPATDVLHIQAIGKTTVVLTNQSGKTLLSKTFDGNGALNIAQLSSGIYYLTNTTTGAVQKVVITR